MANLKVGTTVGGQSVVHAGIIGNQSVNYASSAGAVAWNNVSGKPTNLSSFTNDSGYVTGSHSHTASNVHSWIYATGGDANNYTTFGIYRNYAVNGPIGGHNTIFNVVQSDGNYGFQLGADTRSSADGLYYRSKDTTVGTWKQVASRDWVAGRGYLTSVPAQSWSSITGKPTNLSQFTNDLGNYGGWLTTSGKAADSNLLDGLDSSRFLYTTSGQFSGDWNTLTDGNQEIRLVEVHNITGGAHSNYPTGVYTYGSVLGWQLDNATFKMYASHTGDIAMQTGWNNDGYSGWMNVITSRNISSQSVNYASSAGTASALNTGIIYTSGDNLYVRSLPNGLRIHHNSSVGVFDYKGELRYRNQDGVDHGRFIDHTYWTMKLTLNVGPWNDNNGLGTDGGNCTLAVDSDGKDAAIRHHGPIEEVSDARQKVQILPITNALDKVKQITGSTFYLKSATTRSAGVIAQDVLAAFPEASGGSEETAYTVNYNALVGLLMEAVKEQQATIEELQTRIQNLENK